MKTALVIIKCRHQTSKVYPGIVVQIVGSKSVVVVFIDLHHKQHCVQVSG